MDHGKNFDNIRVDVRDKVTGKAKYVADLTFDGMLHTATVRCMAAKAMITAVHTERAAAVEGVEGVFTARDIPGENIGATEKPIFVAEHVRSAGDAVALVVAKSQQIADYAASLVEIELEKEAGCFSPEAALEEDAQAIHECGNLILNHRVQKGNIEDGFAQADVILEHYFETSRVIPGFMEPEGVVVVPADNELRVYCPCKAPFNIRKITAKACALPMSQVRVIQPTVGGSFGGKDDDVAAMASRAAIAALRLGKPCRTVWRMEESILEGVKRHPFHLTYRVGAKKTGELTAVQVRGFVDGGAYLSKSKTTTFRSGIEATGPYVVENVDVVMKAAYTNNGYAGSVRGFGSPQVDFASESMMDELAEKLGMDPWKIREINAVYDGAISGSGQPLEHTALKECLGALREAFGEDLRPFRRNGKLVGRGIACLYRGESYGAGTPVQDVSGVTIVVNADGSLSVSSGLSEVGQGGHTMLASVILSVLGVPFSQIHIAPVDTDYCIDSGSTAASRGTITAGNAASTALHRRFGFSFAGTLHGVACKFGRWLDSEYWELAV